MRILIADDHELFLKGLEFALRDMFDDVEFVLASNYDKIFEIIETDKNFNLILTDLAMPGATWLEAISKIHEVIPNTPIIVLSAVFEPKIVNKTIELGVSGYIHKTSSNDTIKEAINMVMSGGVYIPSELLTTEICDIFSLDACPTNSEAPKSKLLTNKQMDIINLIAKGLANKQIAYELGLTEGTVKLYITDIFRRLKVYNRTAAVVEASKLGLIKNG
ncbi:MAG: response regulator transcription factor [Alphaproteobacteria bacterium]|nr:response regulator transcription factor [Alphaproteobacteria bacterium]